MDIGDIKRGLKKIRKYALPNVGNLWRFLKNRDYESLKQEHIIDYKSVYKDVRLELEKEESDMPLDQRLAEISERKTRSGIIVFIFFIIIDI